MDSVKKIVKGLGPQKVISVPTLRQMPKNQWLHPIIEALLLVYGSRPKQRYRIQSPTSGL